MENEMNLSAAELEKMANKNRNRKAYHTLPDRAGSHIDSLCRRFGCQEKNASSLYKIQTEEYYIIKRKLCQL